MRRLALLLLTVCFTLALPATAHAHDVLEKATPADGTTVTLLPADVSLVFSEQPLELGLQVVVTGPTGNVAEGLATIQGREVRQAISSAAPAGQYTVAYRVTSDDGHPVSGSFGFFAMTGLDGSTATAGPSVPAPQAEDPAVESAKESQFVPVVLTAAGTLIAIGLFVYVLMKTRRRTPAA